MGDRITLEVTCSKCGKIDEQVWYAPTCGVMTWKCPMCGTIIDLEKYTGVDADSMASTEYGRKAIAEQRKEMKNG